MRRALIYAIGWALVVALASPVGATTVLHIDDDALIDEARAIVHGTITGKTAGTTEDGRIYTEYRLRVAELFKRGEEVRDEGGDELSFREWGGALPTGERYWIPGRGEMEVGDEVVVFVGPTDSRTGVGFTVGLAQGKLRVQRDAEGRARVTRQLGGLRVVDDAGRPVARPPEERDLDAWRRTIRERVRDDR